MSVVVRVYVDDIEERLDLFQVIRLYRDTSPEGVFSTVVVDIPLVAEQQLYSYLDTAGNGGAWYRYAFRNTSTLIESDPSSPFRPGGGTLASMIFEVAKLAGGAFSGTTTAIGTQSSLVDIELAEAGSDEGYLGGSWIRRPGAAASDRDRRLRALPFDPATGGVTPARVWDQAPGFGERYEVYAILPPHQARGMTYSWADAVRAGLNYCWFVDQFVVGVADGNQREFPLTAHPSLLDENRIRDVQVETAGPYPFRYDAGTGPRFWDIRQNGTMDHTLVLSFIPRAGSRVIVEVARQPDAPWQDDDYIEVPEDVAVAAGVLAAYRILNRAPATRGNYQDEVVGALSDFLEKYEPIRPGDVILQR